MRIGVVVLRFVVATGIESFALRREEWESLKRLGHEEVLYGSSAGVPRGNSLGEKQISRAQEAPTYSTGVLFILPGTCKSTLSREMPSSESESQVAMSALVSAMFCPVAESD